MAIGRNEQENEQETGTKAVERAVKPLEREFRCPMCNHLVGSGMLKLIIRCPVCDRANAGDFIEVPLQ